MTVAASRSTARALALALGLAWYGAAAAAQEMPALTGPVNDTAGVIDAATEAELDGLIRRLQAASGDVVIVATVPTIAPYGSIEEYALRLFERAGIGDKDKANGLLIVLATTERRVRVEVGYGLEEYVTDGFAGETIRQEMLPAFREGQYGTGLAAGAQRIIARIAAARRVTLEGLPVEPERPAASRGLTTREIVILVIVVLIILRAARSSGPHLRGRGRRGGTWSGWHGGLGGFGGGLGGFGGGFGGFGGGGSGGGFGGFGGGRSGGGGASGGW